MYTLRVLTISYERIPGDEAIVLVTYLADSSTGVPINQPNTTTTSIRYVSVLVPKSSLPPSNYLAHLETLATDAVQAEFSLALTTQVEDARTSIALTAEEISALLRGMLVQGPGFDPVCAVETVTSATSVALSVPLALAFSGDLISPSISLSGTLVTASYTVTGLSSVVGIVAGMAVSGVGLPSGCFVSAILSSSSVSLTQAALLSVTTTLGFSPTADSDIVTGLSPSIDSSFVGLTIANANLPSDTVIQEYLTSSSATLSNRSTAQVTGGSMLVSGLASVNATLPIALVDLSDLSRVVSIVNFADL